jgi:hypothetical protein
MSTIKSIDLANIEEFKQVLFQMSPQEISKVIQVVESMKPELERRLMIRNEIESMVKTSGFSLKSLKLSRSSVKFKI